MRFNFKYFALIAGILLLLTSSAVSKQNRGAGFTGSRDTKGEIILYVSPEGSGDRFTKRRPGSLIEARDKVRSLTTAMTGNIIVHLLDGTYLLDSTFQLGPEDSGQNGYSVVWQAAPGDMPVLSGGKEISGWTLFDNEKNIWKTNVCDLNFRQLYVNDKRAVRARTPNMTDFADKGPYAKILSWNNFSPAIPASLLSGISDSGKVEFCVNMYWQHFRYRIDSFNVKGDSAFLSFKMPEAEVAPIHVNEQAPFILENAFEFLDAESEWFLDTETGDLFYKPKNEEKMESARVIAPVLETVMKIKGDSASHVQNILVKGLTFKHTNWTVPGERGYTCAQAAFDMQIPGMVEVSNASRIVFERNRFEHSGGFGLVFSAFSNHNKIVGNVVTGISANGIVIDPSFYRDNSVALIDLEYPWMFSKEAMPDIEAGSSHDTIINNLVEFCGRDYNDAVGIYASLPAYLTIKHNEVRFLSYTGISVGWSWRKELTPHRDGEISHNKIYDVCLVNPDGGAIYNLGTVSGEGTRIHHNYIFNVNSPGGWAPRNPMAGLYCDGPGATNVLLDSNVVRNGFNAFQNGSHIEKPNLRYYNNYWQCETLWYDNGAIKGCEAMEKGNVNITDDNWPAEAVSIMKNAGIEIQYQDILNDKN